MAKVTATSVCQSSAAKPQGKRAYLQLPFVILEITEVIYSLNQLGHVQ
jgi:hypothetical protein